MRLRDYTLKELTGAERYFLKHLTAKDLKKARAYIKLCQDSPSETPGPDLDEAKAWEIVKDYEDLYHYIDGKGHAWNDSYMAAYIKAYLLGKAAELKAETNAYLMHPETAAAATPDELDELKANLKDLWKTRAILAGLDISKQSQEEGKD